MLFRSVSQSRYPHGYIEGLEYTVKTALSKCPEGTAEKVVGIAFDTTGSTPVFTDKNGTPLSLWKESPEVR